LNLERAVGADGPHGSARLRAVKKEENLFAPLQFLPLRSRFIRSDTFTTFHVAPTRLRIRRSA